MKQQISLNQTIIELYSRQIAENKEEIEDLIIKEKNMKQDLKDVLKKTDMKELKVLRNNHKLKALIK